LSPIERFESVGRVIVDGTPSRRDAWDLRRFGEEPCAV
jgi:hypothetical protein